MSRPRAAVSGLIALALVAAAAAPLLAASLSEQKTLIRRAGTYLRSADRFAKGDRPDDAAEAYSKAQAALNDIAQEGIDPKLQRAFRRAVKMLRESHAKLSAAGIAVDELEVPAISLTGEPSLGSRDESEDRGRFSPSEVSFVRDIAPMLAGKCGGCHIDSRRGGFSLASYSDLMQGSQGSGRVLVPGDGSTSLIVELIAAGDMPRGGGRVTPAELRKLVTWITQGAKFDGQDESANLRSLRPSAPERGSDAPRGVTPTERVSRPTGSETVSFAMDVAPVLSSKCSECHGVGRPGSRLGLANFREILKGAASGPILNAGNPDSSTLVQRLTGAATPRMPQNRPPLSEQQIQTIATWIREGARFDGDDPGASLERVTALVRADRATADELDAIRVGLAAKNWRLAMPDTSPSFASTDNFYVVGNLPESRLSEIAGKSDRIIGDVMRLFGHPAGEPVAKGRITLYALASRIDFSEFGLMVVNRQFAREEQGVAGYNVVDAYAAVQLGPTEEPADALLLTEQLATIYLQERTKGRLPNWLVAGAARYAAAESDPKNDQVRAWQASLAGHLSDLKNPEDILTDTLPPDSASVLRYAFASALMRKPDKLRSVIAKVSKGTPADSALQQAYGFPPKQLAEMLVSSLRSGT